ncbi:MAG: nitrilase-related carbon-nitrogen hydrolase [Deltaproteobacteria bacterium]
MRDLKIAAVSMSSETGKIEKNLERTASYVAKAAKMGADIICFPELSVTGYTLTHPASIYGRLRSEAIIERIVGMAREKGLLVIAGMVDLAEAEGPYIAQVVVGPAGMVGLYRKTHLSPPEKGIYAAGQELGIFSYRHVTFGIQLCYESHFPELSTLMALRGAEIIFFPHASPRGEPEEKMESWMRHLPSRAFDNGLFLVACNQVGKSGEGLSFPGVALALNPAGRVMEAYCGHREEMILVKLSRDVLEEIRKHRMKYFLPNRRPELYGDISSDSS